MHLRFPPRPPTTSGHQEPSSYWGRIEDASVRKTFEANNTRPASTRNFHNTAKVLPDHAIKRVDTRVPDTRNQSLTK